MTALSKHSTPKPRRRAAAHPTLLRRAATLHLAPLLLYTLLGVIVTWPLAAHFGSAVVGADEAVDAYLHVWNTWLVAHALRAGTSPFFTELLYYPYGADMFWQTLGFSQGVLAAPVTLAWGPIAGFNFVTIAAFPIGGYAAYLLALRVVCNAPAALVAGAIYAFSSFHMDKLIAGNVVASVEWVPWYVLALYVYFERPRWHVGLLCGLLLLWVTFGSWYYGMFCVLFTGFMTLVWMFENGRRRAVATALWGAIPVLVWGLILAPRILSLSEAGDALLWDLRDLQLLRSADVADFFLPNPLHPWWGAQIHALRATMHEDIGIWVVSLGWIGMLLAAIGMAKNWHASRRWLLVTLLSMLFAMGAVLQVAGVNTGIPLPWALIENLPGIRANHRPNHFVVLAMVTLGVLAAFGVRWLIARFSLTQARAWTLALLLSVGVVFIDGYAGPLTVVSRTVHPFYATLPARDGALLPLPLLLNINRSDNLVPQIAHGYPILGGYMARPPRYTFAQYTPGIHELEQGRALERDILSPGWPELGRRALAAYRIRYITLDMATERDPGRLGLGKAEYFAQVRQILQELDIGPPLVADDDLEAYAVPRDWAAEPLLFLGAGWQAVEQQPDAGLRWRWMGEQAALRLYNPLDQPVVVTITLTAASYQHPRSLRLSLDGADLGAFDVPADAPTTWQLRVLLRPGEHTLLLQAAAEPDPGRKNAPISVRVFDITSQFSAPLR